MIGNQRLIYIGLLSIIAGGVLCETAQAQWRGHYVRRDGLFHVERYHWGGGITANGASVLNTGIVQFAPIVGSLIGREAPTEEDSSKERDAPLLSSNEDYLAELSKARQLLLDTAALVNWKPANGPQPVPVPGEQKPPITTTDDKGTPATEQEFGKNPWNKIP